jgi:chromosome segregation ATPase
MNIDLEALGLSTEELQQRVVNGICNLLLNEVISAPGDEEEFSKTKLANKLKDAVKQRTDEAIAALAAKDAEIERLKKLWLDRESMWHNAERQIDQLRAEIERMTRQQSIILGDRESERSKVRDLRAEVAKLKAENKDLIAFKNSVDMHVLEQTDKQLIDTQNNYNQALDELEHLKAERDSAK